ncbi:MAG: SoxR reducing system RseC family protein [Shouchella clausii]
MSDKNKSNNNLSKIDKKINMRIHPLLFGIILFLGFFIPRVFRVNESIIESAIISIVFPGLFFVLFLFFYTRSMKRKGYYLENGKWIKK